MDKIIKNRSASEVAQLLKEYKGKKVYAEIFVTHGFMSNGGYSQYNDYGVISELSCIFTKNTPKKVGLISKLDKSPRHYIVYGRIADFF